MPLSRLLPSALIFGLACCLATPVLAQRNGDVSDGLDNQPTSGEVRSREKAADVAPSPQRNAAQTGTVDTIYKNLMTKENGDGLTRAPTNPNAPMTTAPATTR